MENLVIYGTAQSTFVRTVLLVCEEKGLRYKHTHHNPGSPEQKGVHPFGRVPAISHGEFHLFETSAIVRYLDRVFPEPHLVPQTPKSEAQMNQWISMACDYGFRSLTRDWFLRDQGVLPTDEVATIKAKSNAVVLFGIANNALCNADFLAGNEISLADLFLLPQLMSLSGLDEAHAMIGGFDRLASWYAHMLSRPSVSAIDAA